MRRVKAASSYSRLTLLAVETIRVVYWRILVVPLLLIRFEPFAPVDIGETVAARDVKHRVGTRDGPRRRTEHIANTGHGMRGAQTVATPKPAVVRQTYQVDGRIAPIGAPQSSAVVCNGNSANSPFRQARYDGMAERTYALVAGVRCCIQKCNHTQSHVSNAWIGRA